MSALDDLVREMRGAGVAYPEALVLFQQRYLRQVLACNRGHKGKAALEAGIHRNSLRNALKPRVSIEKWELR
jgi:DNA-binding protein Fis